MCSLTPGILQKLLQNAGNKDFKVAGEHRSAILQVISILPSLEDDPWKSKGYYLRVSDSLHSAYVSVSNEDVELILSDKIQLGQFIYVTRVDHSSPVPVLRGVKPIPKRRSCVGDPKDLISSDFLNAKKGEGNGKSKRNVKVVGYENELVRRLSLGNGKNGGTQNRRLSLDSARRGWERSPTGKNGSKGVAKVNPKDNLVHSDSKLSSVSPLKTKNVIASPNFLTKNTYKLSLEDSQKCSNISPLKNKNFVVSPKPPTARNNTKVVKSSNTDSFPTHMKKLVLSSNILSDSKTNWDLLPSPVRAIGKEVRSCRNRAFVSVVCLLEEASVFESVIQCISIFAGLCDLFRKDSCEPLVEQFLDLHERTTKAALIIRTLINIRASETEEVNGSRICLTPGNKNASLWVQAAVETDLSKFSLYTKKEGSGLANGEKRHFLVLEKPREKANTENHSPIPKQTYFFNRRSSKNELKGREPSSSSKNRVSITNGTNAEHESHFPGSGLKPASLLAESLLASSRAWFFDYLEGSLKNGFGLQSDEDQSRTISLLRHLKRVDKWLDGASQGDGISDGKIQSLKRKLYEFLLHHVDSAVLCR